MRKMVKMSMAAVMIMGIGSVSAQAEGVDILSNIKAKGEIRARYEMVDTDAVIPTTTTKQSNANAFTNRLTIGVSADLLGTDWLSAYAEMTDVRALNDNYNSTDNGETTHATVVDPEQTRLTQAYVDIKLGKPTLRIGRQMINLDNQRFVGAVGWRQMFQTFDAYTLTCNSIENLSVFASYITQVNGVKADEVNAATDTRTALVNVSYKVMPELKATAYAYMIGEGTAGHKTGSDTYGLALTGNVAVADGVKLNYRAEYATQTDASMENSGFSGASSDVDADYMNFELGANVSGILAGLGYEVLSGDSDGAGKEKAFATPLATGHAFNGWADIFLATPTQGIEDMSAYVGYASKEFGKLQVVYHDFQSDVGSIDYGTEIDAVYTRAIPGMNGLTGMLKVADYSAGDTVAEGNNAAQASDTTKFWVMLDYKFASK
ncbi:alginate export family protein [Sulfurimonas sp.]|uniref:alginate export family protein n=1 Tax=Sulfurimonas sp. TaxID=2022749 RepID=UPI001A0B18DB|nr:alginate export family protein [Sulfurimonas sp.]MBE0514440.1 alginate export family protein [Sulfurimonas sp.]